MVIIRTKQEQLAAIVNAYQALGGGAALYGAGIVLTNPVALPPVQEEVQGEEVPLPEGPEAVDAPDLPAIPQPDLPAVDAAPAPAPGPAPAAAPVPGTSDSGAIDENSLRVLPAA